MSFTIRITGTGELPEALDASKTYKLSGSVDCYSVEKKDLQNGEFEVLYKTKWTSAIELEEGGKKIVGTDKKRMSQKLRANIYVYGQELGVPDDEMFYQSLMGKIISNLPFIYEATKNK